MLQPAVIRASYKITTSEVVVLETLAGSNVPLLFPEVWVMNRTTSADSVTVTGQIRTVFTNQPDPDFDGSVLFAPFTSTAVSNGSTAVLTGIPNCLVKTSFGLSTEITITHSGPAAESLVTLVLRGMIESGVSPDYGVSINV